jgi:hypothetical protein
VRAGGHHACAAHTCFGRGDPDLVRDRVREEKRRPPSSPAGFARRQRAQGRRATVGHDVIVYIAVNPILKSNLSGALTWMTQAGDFRYVRASISTELTFDQMIATVAHELQHAVEVIEDASVVDEKSLIALYRRIGEPSRSTQTGWETINAQQTGYKVRRELVTGPASTIAKAAITRS